MWVSRHIAKGREVEGERRDEARWYCCCLRRLKGREAEAFINILGIAVSRGASFAFFCGAFDFGIF